MSADNGLLLWYDGEEYVLSDYNGSRDYESNADMREIGRHRTSAAALAQAQLILKTGYEYGLSLDLSYDRLLKESEAAAALPALSVDEAATVIEAAPRVRPSDLAERAGAA